MVLLGTETHGDEAIVFKGATFWRKFTQDSAILMSISQDTWIWLNYDEIIEDALEDLDLQDMISRRIADAVKDVDLEPVITEIIADYIDEELEDYDFDPVVADAVREQL